MTEQIAGPDVAPWIRRRRRGAGRSIVGICGPPGSGKSTLAARLAAELAAPVVPMDGFHLPNAVLDERGIRAVKGAPHTFDARGFVDAIAAVRRGERTVALPAFDRELDEPQSDALRVPSDAPVVLVEGNYLLLDADPWSELVSLFDLTLYVDLADDVRIERLVARHVQFGKSVAEATEFVHASDERNADLVIASRPRADAMVVER